MSHPCPGRVGRGTLGGQLGDRRPGPEAGGLAPLSPRVPPEALGAHTLGDKSDSENQPLPAHQEERPNQQKQTDCLIVIVFHQRTAKNINIKSLENSQYSSASPPAPNGVAIVLSQPEGYRCVSYTLHT